MQSSSSTPQSPKQRVRKEIVDYIKLSLLDTESDPVQWWKAHITVLLNIANLAQKYFSVCTSS